MYGIIVGDFINGFTLVTKDDGTLWEEDEYGEAKKRLEKFYKGTCKTVDIIGVACTSDMITEDIWEDLTA